MNAFADHFAVPAAGGRRGHPPVIFAHAKSGCDRVHVRALASPTAVTARSGFREELHADIACHVRHDDTLRARKLAAGQGRRRRFPWVRLPAPLPGAEGPFGL
jgi:hypothetical protein